MTFKSQVCVINGPNLNLLGVREPEIYGKTTLQDIIDKLLTLSKLKQNELIHFQSNHEGALIDFLNEEYLRFIKNPEFPTAFIVNLAAYSHTSIALLDALILFANKNVPIFEVHLTNIFKREHFRHHSFVSNIASEVIIGLGASGYEIALHKIFDFFESTHRNVL